MWEILEFGTIPYRTLSNNQVLEQVSNGLRLEQPRNCPDDLWNLILLTWSENAKERPSFPELTKNLIEIKKNYRKELKKIEQGRGQENSTYSKTPVDESLSYSKTPVESHPYSKTPKDEP